MRRTYRTPQLHHLGEMADVTRKTGPLLDGDPNEPGQVVSAYPDWLVDLCTNPCGPIVNFFCINLDFPPCSG